MSTIITQNHSTPVPTVSSSSSTSSSSSSFYKNSNHSAHGSSTSFFQSLPVELATQQGYLEFIAKKKREQKPVTTEFAKDGSSAVVFDSNGEKLATVTGEALNYLFDITS